MPTCTQHHSVGWQSKAQSAQSCWVVRWSVTQGAGSASVYHRSCATYYRRLCFLPLPVPDGKVQKSSINCKSQLTILPSFTASIKIAVFILDSNHVHHHYHHRAEADRRCRFRDHFLRRCLREYFCHLQCWLLLTLSFNLKAYTDSLEDKEVISTWPSGGNRSVYVVPHQARFLTNEQIELPTKCPPRSSTTKRHLTGSGGASISSPSRNGINGSSCAFFTASHSASYMKPHTDNLTVFSIRHRYSPPRPPTLQRTIQAGPSSPRTTPASPPLMSPTTSPPSANTPRKPSTDDTAVVSSPGFRP